MKSFTPSPDHTDTFRSALGQFATGVTVVTAASTRGPVGMTVNSFTSVSLDPPLIMWCPAKLSARYESFIAATHFAVHVLRKDQLNIARRFAEQGDNFTGLDIHKGAHDVPLSDSCLSRLECKTEQIVDAGDHSIILARVLRTMISDGDPLVFHARRFGGFDART